MSKHGQSLLPIRRGYNRKTGLFQIGTNQLYDLWFVIYNKYLFTQLIYSLSPTPILEFYLGEDGETQFRVAPHDGQTFQSVFTPRPQVGHLRTYVGSAGAGCEFAGGSGLGLDRKSGLRFPRATSIIINTGIPINTSKKNNIKIKPTPIIILASPKQLIHYLLYIPSIFVSSSRVCTASSSTALISNWVRR